MAENADKKAEAAAAPSEGKSADKKKGGILTKVPVLLGGVMVIEAAVLFAGFKLLGAKPQPAGATLATGADGLAADKDKKPKTLEIQVGDYKALNRTNGHTFLYEISIYVIAKPENESRLNDAFKDDKALIEDRIRTIIAESDPDKLGGGSEPGLETLRRQVKYQLDRIVGDGVIDEVLVPRCIPFRTDY